MKKTLLLSGLLSTALVMACAGDDGKDTAGATNPTGAGTTTSASGSGSDTDTEGMTNTSGGSGATTGASGTTTGGGTTGDTTGETGCSFLDCTTGDTMPDVQCDIWNNDCPDGQKCMPWAGDGGSSWNATKCSPIDPNPGKPGDECTVEGSGVSGVDSCEAGAMCWNVDPETGVGYCIGFCDGSPESYTCAEPNTTCTIVNNGVLILCLPGCDPLLQDCEGGDVCIGTADGFICVLDASGEEGQFGDPCEYANVCDPGLACLNPEYVPNCNAGGCCSPFCELETEYTQIPAPAPNCPDPQMACLAWYEQDAPPGYAKVGICGIPQ